MVGCDFQQLGRINQAMNFIKDYSLAA
jgi:hypothetical protein